MKKLVQFLKGSIEKVFNRNSSLWERSIRIS